MQPLLAERGLILRLDGTVRQLEAHLGSSVLVVSALGPKEITLYVITALSQACELYTPTLPKYNLLHPFLHSLLHQA